MTRAILTLSAIEPVEGQVQPTPTGYVFSVERMILPDGEMPRDDVATLQVADGPPEEVHLENVNVSRSDDVEGSNVFRGRIILRSAGAPTP